MKIKTPKNMKLKELYRQMKGIKEKGYEVWIEGKGDGSIGLIVQEPFFIILPNNHLKGGLNKNDNHKKMRRGFRAKANEKHSRLGSS